MHDFRHFSFKYYKSTFVGGVEVLNMPPTNYFICVKILLQHYIFVD